MDKSPSASSASSPLSMHDSDAAFEAEYFDEVNEPASKRPRLETSHVEGGVDLDILSPISSDTSGDVPSSFTALHPDDDEPYREQVTECQWDSCTAGDMGNMDKLVEHIHNVHIEGRHKKFTCEWIDCNRKSMPHASAYALKAHMRSHTREKPFYCVLPECDRSFTRSDALAKHMRTVHETEALRPSDPVPKSLQPQSKPNKHLKLVIKQQQDFSVKSKASSSNLRDQLVEFDSAPPSDQDPHSAHPNENFFTVEEMALDSNDLWYLLVQQIKSADEEQEELQREIDFHEAIRKKEWVEKEILFEQVVENEIDRHERRKLVLATLSNSSDVKTLAASRSGPAAGSSADVQETETEIYQDRRPGSTAVVDVAQV